MGTVSVIEGAMRMPPKARSREFPYLATRILLGAKVLRNYKGKKDLVAIELAGKKWEVCSADFDEVEKLANRLELELEPRRIVSAEQVLKLHERAAQLAAGTSDGRSGRGLVMLKDTTGSGYWRMVLPARYMDTTGLYVDVTAAQVNFDYLLEYDYVFVQRMHDWESYYALARLKAAGKRIVYDIDDEIFAIPPDNPASRTIGKDEQAAALACMRLADCVTTTTPVLQARLTELSGGREPVVVPNALDLDAGWFPDEQTGSPDGWKRIFWQGSATHAADWMECAEAVDEVMRAHDKVRMVILGFLPPAVQSRLSLPHWKGRVEYVGFSSPETYFEIAKHVRADVGIAPLEPTYFNEGKSSIKWLEYAMMGMPAAASDWGPYREAITDESEGFLCSTKEDWVEALTTCLFDDAERLRRVKAARARARECYDIRSTVVTWRRILTGEAG
jgi:glycosyltransferase involved in cell wall biosynthesis